MHVNEKMAFQDKLLQERGHCTPLLYLIFVNACIIAFCTCDNGSGQSADPYQTVAEQEGCLPNPCSNGAQCFPDKDGYRCQCNDGFTGSRCETDIDDCASKPCSNGGRCVDETNSYRCICRKGYKGLRCQDEINQCLSEPCLNGATCVNSLNAFSCKCRKGYKGQFCEDKDACALNPCQFGSKCVPNGIGKYTCKCKAGLSGKNCEHDIDDCISEPCQNGGTCVDGINQFTCKCRAGFTGKLCKTDIDECASNPCSTHAVCVQGRNKYTCRCKRGYSGANCEIDECASHPCQNGATCKQGLNTYKCYCKKGFSGTNCQVAAKARKQEDTTQDTQSIKWLIYPAIALVATVLLLEGSYVSHWVAKVSHWFGYKKTKDKGNPSKTLNTFDRDRKKYDERFESAKQRANQGISLLYEDIPWPNEHGIAGDCDILFAGMDILSLEYKERVRKERYRWHPDKFTQMFGNSIHPGDADNIMARVNDISQNINELIEMDIDEEYD